MIIRFFVVRPLVQGAFLSDEWATILAKTLLSNRPANDRNLVNKVAAMWEVDLQKVKLSNGSNLWQVFTGQIVPKRNDFVHKAQRVDKKVAVLALDCAKTLMKDLVPAIAMKAGLSWPDSGSWHRVLQGVGGGRSFTTYGPQSPFN
jgi:hypothetical protein